jgi:hypothetical protein
MKNTVVRTSESLIAWILLQDSSYGANIGTTFWGPFFTGAYLHQKLDLAPPFERELYSVQKHVLSYQVKISEGCFVWDAPTLV